jgi:peptidyl-prolyl cis-trans isomerase C
METMLTTKNNLRNFMLRLILLVSLLSACSKNNAPTKTVTPTDLQPTATQTPSEPTPTPIPAAAIVNDERVPLGWVESEFQRYLIAQENLGETVDDEAAARDIVLNDLIDQMLLAQGATEAGFTISDDNVQAKIDALAVEVDLPAWMAQWGYTDSDLFDLMKLQLLAADQRDQIAETIPESMEQVEIRQVFAYTSEGAKSAKISLDSGTPFEEVAFLYDPVAGGYLGWVPRGYLLVSAVEDAAFSLPVGSYSDIIESDIGYHIVMVLDKEDHPLSSDARLTLQRQALQNWVAERRANSTIEILGN